MNSYYTDNKIVNEVGKINFSGNVIPQSWYQTIAKDNGKPDLRAIIFLSDIVYWYRPKEVRDEKTGNFIGYKKKFKRDLLQRSYRQLSDQFGCSKREAQTTVAFLEKMGVIKRIFRTETYKGIRANNIMYIFLEVEVLKKLTYPDENDSPLHEKVIPITEKRYRVSQKKVIAPTSNRGTNTKINTEITTKNINQSCLDEKLKELIRQDLLGKHELHRHCKKNKGALTYALRCLSKLDTDSSEKYFADDTKQTVFEESVQALIEMASGLNPKYDAEDVIGKIQTTVKEDDQHDLFTMIDEVSRSYLDHCSKFKVSNPKAYLEKALYNGFDTYRLQYKTNIKNLVGCKF